MLKDPKETEVALMKEWPRVAAIMTKEIGLPMEEMTRDPRGLKKWLYEQGLGLWVGSFAKKIARITRVNEAEVEAYFRAA